jgi:hypothetical protein
MAKHKTHVLSVELKPNGLVFGQNHPVEHYLDAMSDQGWEIVSIAQLRSTLADPLMLLITMRRP